jgi:hypothetical protein
MKGLDDIKAPSSVSTGLHPSESTELQGAEIRRSIFYRLTKEPFVFHDEIRSEEKYFDETQTKGQILAADFNFIYLRLCPCLKMPRPLRSWLEDRSIALLSHLHAPSKESLTVVSVGPGEGYQELVCLAKLVDAGYKKIIVVLIDPGPVLDRILRGVCQRHLSQSTIDVLPQYRSLESYAQEARQSASLRPDLLLMIDLTDEQYRVGRKLLTEHAFEVLRETECLKCGTVIAYSEHPNPDPKAIFCSYDGSPMLSAVEQNRNEQVQPRAEQTPVVACKKKSSKRARLQ